MIEFTNHEHIDLPYEEYSFKEYIFNFHPELISYDTDENETPYINDEVTDVTIKRRDMNVWDKVRLEEDLLNQIRKVIMM